MFGVLRSYNCADHPVGPNGSLTTGLMSLALVGHMINIRNDGPIWSQPKASQYWFTVGPPSATLAQQ